MSILYNEPEPKILPWEQYWIWTKSIFWLPSEDEDLKEDNRGVTKPGAHTGMLEATLLSEKVVMYTVDDCILSEIQTEILATLVPSELITQDTLQGKTRSHFVGVLMFGDVSGFTALCEKYFAEGGKGGTYKLTATLNCYIGAMVDVIYSYGGDIIKFSGDAFLAVWRVSINVYIYEIVHKAIECALNIQHSLGSYETDVNVLLRVKLAISAGNVVFSSIGDEGSKYYVIVGEAVDDVKEAQDTCVSGDVVLAPSAWGHCSQVNYLYTFKDEKHIKILRIIYHPMQVNRKVYQLPPKFIVDLEKKYKHQITRYKQLDSVIDLSSTKYETVRPEVTLAAERGLGPYLRPYLIPPVVAQVDAEQPLEYLTEMRQVITVFINLVLEKKGTLDTIDRVDEVYTKIWQVVHKQMGVVNKVCMFDKDIMFLVIFGLRGAHHEYNAMKALKCAYKIRSLISPLPQVLTISCGVTIGMTYCGVVGHPLRQEYTVIGAPVNKAARLMMYYPGRVACDQQVYFSSGLSSIYFIEQEQKTLKGIGKVSGIYEYTEGRRGMGNVNIYHLPPLLGQEAELNTFRNMLQGGEGFPVGFLYLGSSGIGKSRLFEEFLIMCVNRYFKTIFLTLQANNSGTPCYVLQQIFKQVLSAVASNEDLKGKNEKVMAFLANTEYERFAFLLNPILNLSIPDKCPPEMFTLNLHEVRVLRDSVFKKLVDVACVDMILFIDNIEFCDNRSADLLPIFLEEGSTALVMSANKKSSPKVRKWFKNVKLIICELMPLDEDYLAPLACQLLGVRAISKELVELIESQPEATPGWCQRYLQSLLDSRVIHIEKMARKHLKTFEDMVIPDFKLLQKRVIGQELRPNRITFVNYPSKGESMDDEISICTVVKTAEGLELTFPGTMEAVIMSAFDCLSPYEQLLLKCGSVIGDTFPREMLHAILFKRSPRETAQAIKRLFEMHILCCANTEDLRLDVYSYDIKSIETNLTLAANFEVCCYCKQRTTHDDFEDAYSFPYYAFCNELQFTVPLFRCKTYDLLPLNQKALFHTRVAAFLELKLHQPEYLKFGVPNYWRALLKAMSMLTSMSPSPETQQNKQKQLEFRDFSFKFTDRFNPSLYEDIISHLNKAGHKDREILVLIEYGQAALLAGCSKRAVNALHLAEDKLSEMSHSREFRENYDLIHLRAKIHVIAAQGYLDLRYLETSRSELYKAKRLIFGTAFQYWLFHATKPSFANRTRRAIHTSKFFHWLFRSKETLCLTKTEYLNVLCNSLMINSEWYRALSISHKAILTMMKCAKQNVCLIYNTFANLIDIYNHLGKFTKATKFYNFALKVASSLPFDENDIVQQISKARLDTTFYTCSFMQGQLELCYEMGESLHKMSLQLGCHDAALYITTIRLNVLMRMKKYEKFAACNENFRNQVRTSLTRVHYYINCVMFHLYSGVVIKSAYDILLLLEFNKLQLSRPLCNVLGVYLIRRNELKFHKYIENELKPPIIINKYNIHYEIIYLEYWLMKTFKMIDNKELKDPTEINEVMNKLTTFILEIKRTVVESTPHLLPRYVPEVNGKLFLLIAYFNQLKDNEARSLRYLKAGLQLSLKFGDELEYEWMSHNKQMWSNINKAKHLGTNPSYTDGWRAHSTYNTHVHVFDYERYSPSNLLFTLPLLIEGTVSDVPWELDTTSEDLAIATSSTVP